MKIDKINCRKCLLLNKKGRDTNGNKAGTQLEDRDEEGAILLSWC